MLENHLHLIAQSPDLPAEIGSFKSWTAKRLLEVLKEQRAERILKQLALHWRNSSARIYAGESGILNIDREW